MIGQRTREEFAKGAWPELWVWLRLGVFLAAGAFCFLIAWFLGIGAFNSIGQMFVFWGIAAVAQTPITSMCKAVAKAIERLRR